MSLNLSRHLGELMRLAVPVIVARTGIMTMSLVDVAFLGHAGADQVAYMAIAGVAIGTLIVSSIGLMVGTMVEVAQAYGAGRVAECGPIWRRSLGYAAVAGAIGAFLCLFGGPLFRAMGQTPDVAAGAAPVLAILGLCLPGTTLFVTTTFFLEAIKRPLPGMITILVANILNAFLNWVFVFGHLGFPAMGAEGSAMATSITRLAMAAMLIGYVLMAYDLQRYAVRLKPAGGWRTNWAAGAKARQMGYASGASYGLEAAAFGSMSIFAGWLGVMELAAWSIALNTMSMVFMTAVGLGVGTAVRVGHALGRGDRHEMAVAGWVGLGATAFAMGVASLGFLLLNEPLARIFSNDPALIALGAVMLAMAGWVMIADGSQGMMLSAVRATGDTWIPTLMHFTSYFGVMIPLAWALAFPLGLGAAGLFLGILGASVVAVGLLSWRFHQRTQHA